MSKVDQIIASLNSENVYYFSYSSKQEEGNFKFTITFLEKIEKYEINECYQYLFCEPETRIRVVTQSELIEFLTKKINYLH